MIVRNTVNKDIMKLTYGGFEFNIPADETCAIWDPAGKHFTNKIYRKEASTKEDRGGLPPLIEIDASYWDGKTYAQVNRFQIDHTRIPNRNDLISLAKKRGVNKEFIDKVQEEGSDLENEDIVSEINRLPVPEKVRIPDVETVKKAAVKKEPKKNKVKNGEKVKMTNKK